MRTNVLVKLDHEKAVMPIYKTKGASCADVSSVEECTLYPRQRKVVSTGLRLELLTDFECQVRSRSGLAANRGIIVLNSPGTVDSDYRGTLKVILFNTSDEPYNIYSGSRIAQIAIVPIQQHKFIPVNWTSDTERGEDGFGSTGVEVNE